MAEQEPECPAGAPMWMTTFSDLVTLLLTFFVLLLSMASMDPVKFVQAKTSIKDAFGWRTTAAPKQYSLPIIPSPPKAKFSPIPQETVSKVYKRIKADIELDCPHPRDLSKGDLAALRKEIYFLMGLHSAL